MGKAPILSIKADETNLSISVTFSYKTNTPAEVASAHTDMLKKSIMAGSYRGKVTISKTRLVFTAFFNHHQEWQNYLLSLTPTV